MSKTLRYGIPSCMLTALLVSGCSNVDHDSSAVTTDEALRPASSTVLTGNQSYFGVLPCANCPGIETQLDLLEGGTYFLTQTYQDRDDATFSQMGLWEIEGDRLILHHGQHDTLIYFANETGGWLQADTLGNPIVSQLNYNLEPKGWQPAKIQKQINGMLTYMADAPSLVECSTGLRFPVVMTPEWLEVERAYLSSTSSGGNYLHTQVEVSLTWETPEEGPTRHHLRFNQLQEMLPATTCGNPVSELEHHEWDVISLDGIAPAELEEMSIRPYVRFSGQQLSGHSGCNVMAGPIKLEGDHIDLGPIASTRMFCQDAAEIESRFLAMIEKAEYGSLEGQHWTWYDENMSRLVSFERKPIDE